jgi:large subunit ribosomal protein LP0
LIINKNTVIKKAITLRANPLPEDFPGREELQRLGKEIPQLTELLPLCKQKIGLVFSTTPAFELKPLIESNKVQAAAKVGTTAPQGVIVPPGPTGLDPSNISFFHAL